MMMRNTSVQNKKTHQPETNSCKGVALEWWQDAFEIAELEQSKIAYRKRRSCFMEYIRIDGEDEMHVTEVLDIREDKIERFKSISRIKTKCTFTVLIALENYSYQIPFGSNQLGFFLCIINFFPYHESDRYS
jgi:hypothetical protein